MPTVAGALGGTTNVTVATGGTLMLEASNSVNSSASLTLNGGAVQIGAALGQNLGDWTLNNTSTVDFGSYAASLSFTSLAINGSLSIWNWNAMADSIGISGSYSGDLSQIVFYSDSGTNEIGTGAIVGGQLEAVPEPLSNAYLGLGIICFLIYLRRAKAS